jgi:hypothetical protein
MASPVRANKTNAPCAAETQKSADERSPLCSHLAQVPAVRTRKTTWPSALLAMSQLRDEAQPRRLQPRQRGRRRRPRGMPPSTSAPNFCRAKTGEQMKKLLLSGIAALLLATGAAQADNAIDEWKGAWQDCSSHNIPGRGVCVGRSCEGSWPGPSDQCSAKAQSDRWLKRAEKQRKRCRRYLDDTPTYKQIIRFDHCMQTWRKRNRLGR